MNQLTLEWFSVRVRQLQPSLVDINREKQFIQKHSNLVNNLQYHLYVTPEISIYLNLNQDNEQNNKLNNSLNFNTDHSFLFVLSNLSKSNNNNVVSVVENENIIAISEVIVEPKLSDHNVLATHSYVDSNIQGCTLTSSSTSIWLSKELLSKLSLEADKYIMIAPIKRDYIIPASTIYLSNPRSIITDNIRHQSMLMKVNFKDMIRSNLKSGLSNGTLIRLNINNNNNNNNNRLSVANMMLSNGSIYQFDFNIEDINSNSGKIFNKQLNDWRLVTNNTEIIYKDNADVERDTNRSVNSSKKDIFESYDEQRKKIRALFNICFNEQQSKRFQQYGMNKPRSLLLHGPSSSGKRTLIRGLAKELGNQIDDIVILSTNDLIKYSTRSRGFQHKFNYTKHLKNSIFLIEHIEELFPGSGHGDNDSADTVLEQSLESTFINIFNEINNNTSSIYNNVFIVGITSNIRRLNVMIRSLFEDEIKFEPPTSMKRLEIFKNHIGDEIGTNYSKENLDVLNDVNDDCSGLVGGDISLLCREAIINSIKRLKDFDIKNIKFIRDDFIGKIIQQKRLTEKSSLSKLVPSMPKVSWNDIGGLEQVKQSLMEMVVWDYQHGDSLKRLGVKTPRGVLLYGPPGTGKTLLSKAVAFEAKANFIAVNISEVVQGEIGESEKTIAEIFRVARATSPSIIFIDEIQSVFGQKESTGQHGKNVISQILIEMDQLAEDAQSGKRVMVLAATNLPQAIDESFLQPGRFDRALYVGPPEHAERKQILDNLARKLKLADDVDLQDVANWTVNFTGSDLNGLLKKSALYSLERDINSQSISMSDIKKVFWETTPTITPASLEIFKEWEDSLKKKKQS